MKNEIGKIVDSRVSIPVPLALLKCLIIYQLCFELWPLVVSAKPWFRLWNEFGIKYI